MTSSVSPTRAALALAASLCLTAIGAAPSASAAEPTPPKRPLRHHFQSNDWWASYLVGGLAGAIGGGVGAAALGGISDDCGELCLWFYETDATVGYAIGSTLAGPAAIYLYGEAAGYSGNYWAAAAGWSLGVVAGVGLLEAGQDSGGGALVGLFALVALPPLGSTVGYVLSIDDGHSEPPPVNALLAIDGDGLRLSGPALSVTLDRKGGLDRVELGLVGGRF